MHCLPQAGSTDVACEQASVSSVKLFFSLVSIHVKHFVHRKCNVQEYLDKFASRMPRTIPCSRLLGKAGLYKSLAL